jgi:PPOX class probable F420-dependent enzyme
VNRDGADAQAYALAMGLGIEKYVAFTTFKRDGTPVSTPVWIVDLDDGRVGFWTSSQAGKAKRLRNSPKIVIQPSDGRGKVKDGTTPTDGTAELVTSGPVLDEVTAKVKAKYGVMVGFTKFFNTLGHLFKAKQPYGDTAVVVTLT